MSLHADAPFPQRTSSSPTAISAGPFARCSRASSTGSASWPASSPTWSRSASTPGASTTGCSTATDSSRPADRLSRRPHEHGRRRRPPDASTPAELYAINGLQFLPFNTLYQLVADQRGGRLEGAAHVVLIPDLIAYWLTGELRTEVTNASTTGLLDARTGSGRASCCDGSDLPAELLPPLEQPGEVRGAVKEELRAQLGLPPSTVVTTVGSHDTASAVVGGSRRRPPRSPTSRVARGRSSGWSSTSRSSPPPAGPPTSRTRAASTGEPGSCATPAGCGCCRNRCGRGARRADHSDLADAARRRRGAAAGGPLIDVGDPMFIPPGDMPARIAAAAEAARRHAADDAGRHHPMHRRLAGRRLRHHDRARRPSSPTRVDVVHIVGGGSQNKLLCQLTADRTRPARRRGTGRSDGPRQRADPGPRRRRRRRPRSTRSVSTSPAWWTSRGCEPAVRERPGRGSRTS